MTEQERNKALARSFYEALARGDMDAVVDAYAKDGVCRIMGHTLISGTMSKQQIATGGKAIVETFPKGLSFTILRMTAEEDRVAIEAVSRAEHVSGKIYTNAYHNILRFRDGKVVECTEYMDTEAVTEVLCGGQRPAPAA